VHRVSLRFLFECRYNRLHHHRYIFAALFDVRKHLVFALPSVLAVVAVLLFRAVNKDGIVRGNYFNTKDNNNQQVDGSVDKKTQRIAWVVEDKKNIIFDTGLYNLTKDETPVLVHFGKDKTEQWLLVRLKQPPQNDSAQQ